MAIGVVIVLLMAQLLQAQQQACDLSYPTVCIAPAPPDLECPDARASNFEVRQPDPHNFDDDQDGDGCEV
jgi:micrococcal nuclease